MILLKKAKTPISVTTSLERESTPHWMVHCKKIRTLELVTSVAPCIYEVSGYAAIITLYKILVVQQLCSAVYHLSFNNSGCI